jgi:peptidoglycan/xylan/chitin deacetylase (PgdA/CDA1 family)
VAAELGLKVVGWSVSGRDGTAVVRPARVAARVQKGLRNGAIVLLHDAAERDDHEPAGPLALSAVLDAIDAKQLVVVPLTTWTE